MQVNSWFNSLEFIIQNSKTTILRGDIVFSVRHHESTQRKKLEMQIWFGKRAKQLK